MCTLNNLQTAVIDLLNLSDMYNRAQLVTAQEGQHVNLAKGFVDGDSSERLP
jgi:hypothetical protein